MFDLSPEAPITDSVAPGIDDSVAPLVGDKGTSDFLGKLSVFDFDDDDFSVDENVVVFDLIIPEVPFTDGVAPGIDDSVAPVVGDKGTSGSFGKLSVYTILAGLLQHRTNRRNLEYQSSEKEKKEKTITSSRHSKKSI